MFLKSSILFIYTETPLHAGTGTGLGAVDLPIQRERRTDYPIVQASGIKGALRSEAPNGGERGEETVAVFGHEDAEHAGALSPGDARVLLFPVRSLQGVFAWTTSVDVLKRFERDTELTGVDLPTVPSEAPDTNQTLVAGDGVLAGDKVVLEEFAFEATADDEVRSLAVWLSENAFPSRNDASEYDYYRSKLPSSLVILPDEALRDFVKHATEVVTRVRLTEEKTVQTGALWTQEYLPSETLLYSPVHATRLRLEEDDKPASLAATDPCVEAQNVLDWVSNSENILHRLQLGGDETVGRGLVRLRWQGGAA